MSNATNYTQILKDHLYSCIKACEDAIEAFNKVKKSGQPSLDNDAHNAAVDACRTCIEACKLLNNSATVYLAHNAETDNTTQVQNVVKQSNICIAGCTQIIQACDHISKKCADMIASTINTLEDCIEACKKGANHKGL